LKPSSGRASADQDHDLRRRPTINDVARMAGVSKKTVSRVINGSPSVRPDTRKRIEAVIAETGYVPDPQARGLAFRRSFLVGFIYDSPDAQYVLDLQNGLLDAMRGSGFELVVHRCERDDPNILPGIRAFIARQKLFGVVLTPPVSDDERIGELMAEIGCEYVRVAAAPLGAPGLPAREIGRRAAETVLGSLVALESADPLRRLAVEPTAPVGTPGSLCR
jgi:LacI family transcriptional regulator